MYKPSSQSNEESSPVILPSSNDPESGPSKPKKPRATINILDEKLVGALDRCGVTDRYAVFLLTAICESLFKKNLLNVDLDSLVINRTSIRRHRQKIREQKYALIKEEFKNLNLNSLVVHWDGKLLPNLLNSATIDRLPIVVTSGDYEILLGVPELQGSTGLEQATSVNEMLCDWGIQKNVEALCCDTTSSNLGIHKGAAVILEKTLKKDLLVLSCRHHIFELVLRTAFETVLPKTTGPTVPLFTTFQKDWKDNKIKHSNFKTGVEDPTVQCILSDKITDIDLFVKKKLACVQNLPRDDYKEFLQLVLIFIGKGPENYSFLKPGATSHARWMAKAIYALKIYLFRDEFQGFDDEDQKNKLRDLCIFIVLIYVKTWFSATNLIKAPNHDLNLLKELNDYKSVNDSIACATLAKFKEHLWYLNPELAVVAIFDKTVSIEVKTNISKKLREQIDKEDKNVDSELINRTGNIKRYKTKNIDDLFEKNIDFFVTSKSLRFFTRFNLKTDFLDKPPSEWSKQESYIEASKIIGKIKVVNDCAERGVKLMKEFNGKFTKDEKMLQFVLKIVDSHRKSNPTAIKRTSY